MTALAVTQRWRDGRHGWRPASEGGFNPDRYSVSEIGETTAAAFVQRHHYSTSWPAARLRYGLHDADKLVGAIVLGVPMSKAVLCNPFPTLEPYVESLELSRLVLLDEVPANAESWFCAAVFRLAADRGVRGVVAFSDPEPRWRRLQGKAPEEIKPGHVGIVYQALNFEYLGRGTRRSLVMLPDATVVTARALAKVTGGERGRDGVVKRLVDLGATPPRLDEEPAVWLRRALATVGAARQNHPGNHRYAIRTGRNRAERTRVAIGMASHTYPKATLSLFGSTP